MRLIHYTKEEFELIRRIYPQEHLKWQAKPYGLWVSVEGPNDWKSWCESEEFNRHNLLVSYEVKLKENANILHLKTEEEIIEFTINYLPFKKEWKDYENISQFTKLYPYTRHPLIEIMEKDLCETYELDWNKVKAKYQGIIIAPYQWNCRLSSKTSWYYTWDCASGCIWDIDCIEEFKLIEA